MKLKTYLQRNKISMTAFAARICRAVSTVSRIVNGKTKPDWTTLAMIRKETRGTVTANDFTGPDIFGKRKP